MDALRKGWTPELIEGRLKVEWPDDPRMRISHECLYRWIYAKPQRALGLRRYLPRSKRHRTRSKGRRARGPRIPMRVPITDRPKKVDSRHLQAIVREINDTPPMKVLDWETPNEVWYRKLGKVMSKTSHPKTSVALTN